MTQHQQLQKKINGIIQPDAEKLLVQGCELIAKEDYGQIHKGDVINFNEDLFFLYSKDNFEILGQKLNLEAVLMALGKQSCYRGIFHHKTYCIVKYDKDNFIWGLLLTLDQQPIETQKALFEIFEIN